MIVEVSPAGIAGARDGVRATRRALEDGVLVLRHRAASLGVPTAGFDEVGMLADRLGTAVLPVMDVHLRRAEDLANARYHGDLHACLPVADDDPPWDPVPAYELTPWAGGGVGMQFPAGPVDQEDAEEQEAEQSFDLGGWFADRWHDAGDVVAGVGDWIGDRASEVWQGITGLGAAIGDWWDRATADLGAWIDEHGAGLREWIKENVGWLRWLASALRVVGWVLVVVGAVLAVFLAVIGAMGGAAVGAVFGFGVGAVPGGVAGVLAGLEFGLQIVGVGFTLVSVGDFLDVMCDWGEGRIDGQALVQRGAFELAMAALSLVGAGIVGKVLQKVLRHLPPGLRSRVDEWLAKVLRRSGPLDEGGMLAPLRNGEPSGAGWSRTGDVRPDLEYGTPRTGAPGSVPSDARPPGTVSEQMADLGADPAHPWGVDPASGAALTEAQWAARYLDQEGNLRWPPNYGAAPGSRIEFTDTDAFRALYGDRFDRVGSSDGSYLGVPPGTPFAARGLPPSSMAGPLARYDLAPGPLPPGYTIQVSQIAPAFGQPGGGIQAQVFRNGVPQTVDKLVDAGILVPR